MKTSNKGIYTVIASIAIQLCLGIAYIWSVFQTGIAQSIFGGDNAAASLTFSLLLLTMTIGSVIGGKLALKYSEKVVIIIGGILVSAGFLIASFTTSEFPYLIWLSYGVMGGVGMGFTYSTTIACAQRWYPHKKGLITGIIVSALGFGGVVFTPLVEYSIKYFGGTGVGETKTFMILSVVFLVVCTLGGLFTKNPPKEMMAANSSAVNVEQGNNASPKEMLKTVSFYLITVTFALGCMGGLMMIGFAKPIAEAKGLVETATIGVLLISMFNSVGRLVCGMISDKIGRINTILFLLTGSTILTLTVGYYIYVIIGLIGFFYGGLLSTFPSLTSDLFGPKHQATNYGFVLLGFGVGAVLSSQVAGYYKNIAATDISLMTPAFLIASACSFIGIILIIILKKVNSPKIDTQS